MTDMYSAGFYPFATQEEKWAYWSRHISVSYTHLYSCLYFTKSAYKKEQRKQTGLKLVLNEQARESDEYTQTGMPQNFHSARRSFQTFSRRPANINHFASSLGAFAISTALTVLPSCQNLLHFDKQPGQMISRSKYDPLPKICMSKHLPLSSWLMPLPHRNGADIGRSPNEDS